ncbi:ABC transporter substrate-binding protein [Methylomonas koyamae]|uniref:Cobalamin-binding protein n=1 Tax=Methylomonas koyamae TaxID=702114 RepID=A0A291IDG5_9GAMM|nr:ABC transporter substrate-binding protein [Methylomonas koyamae]ATG88293.1 iron complex transport system substrate-binding protein [Methylomonas koyamae]OAI25551.1 cobalamin-binding protein [Methylomonas koyamae]
MNGPQRIVCLTGETTEVLYLLNQQWRIAGISGYTSRPAAARKEKPKVAGFTSANIGKILALQPDLVLTCTNLQADIAAALIKAGIEVHAFNQRSLAGILQMVSTLGALVDAVEAAAALRAELEGLLASARAEAEALTAKPKVYFEEWNDPLISGIGWVSEIVESAGASDCFAELGRQAAAKDRIIADPNLVVERQPDIIVGSWCGKKFRPEQVVARPGWTEIPAVQHGFVYEIKSADILQPGPAVFRHGLRQMQNLVRQWTAWRAAHG